MKEWARQTADGVDVHVIRGCALPAAADGLKAVS